MFTQIRMLCLLVGNHLGGNGYVTKMCLRCDWLMHFNHSYLHLLSSSTPFDSLSVYFILQICTKVVTNLTLNTEKINLYQDENYQIYCTKVEKDIVNNNWIPVVNKSKRWNFQDYLIVFVFFVEKISYRNGGAVVAMLWTQTLMTLNRPYRIKKFHFDQSLISILFYKLLQL